MTPKIFRLLGRSCKKMALNRKIQIKLVAVMQGSTDERHLIQRQGQEEQPIGHDDPDVQKLPNEPALVLAGGVGLPF